MKNKNVYIFTFLITCILAIIPFLSLAIKQDEIKLTNSSNIDIVAVVCRYDKQGIAETSDQKNNYITIPKQKTKTISDQLSIASENITSETTNKLHIIPALDQAAMYAYNCNYSKPIKSYDITNYPSNLNFDCDCSGDLEDYKLIQFIPTPRLENNVIPTKVSLEYIELENKYLCIDNLAYSQSQFITVDSGPITYSINYAQDIINQGDPCLYDLAKDFVLLDNTEYIFSHSIQPLTKPVLIKNQLLSNNPSSSNEVTMIIKSQDGLCINNASVAPSVNNQYSLKLGDKINIVTEGVCSTSIDTQYEVTNLSNKDSIIFENKSAITTIAPTNSATFANVTIDKIGNYCVDNVMYTIPEINGDETASAYFKDFQFSFGKDYKVKYLSNLVDCAYPNAPETVLNIPVGNSALLSPILYLDISELKCVAKDGVVIKEQLEPINNSEIYLNNKSAFDMIAIPCLDNQNLFKIDDYQYIPVFERIKSNSISVMAKRDKYSLKNNEFSEFLNQDSNGIYDAEFPEKLSKITIKILPYFKEYSTNTKLLDNSCQSKGVTELVDTKWSNTYQFNCNCTLINNGNLDYTINLKNQEIAAKSFLTVISDNKYTYCVNGVGKYSLVKNEIPSGPTKIDVINGSVNKDCTNSSNTFAFEAAPNTEYILTMDNKTIVKSLSKPSYTSNFNTLIDQNLISDLTGYYEVCINGDLINSIKSDQLFPTLTPYNLNTNYSNNFYMKEGDKISFGVASSNGLIEKCGNPIYTIDSSLSDLVIALKEPILSIIDSRSINPLLSNNAFVNIGYNFENNPNIEIDRSEVYQMCINDTLTYSELTGDIVDSYRLGFRLPAGKSKLNLAVNGKCLLDKSINIEVADNTIYNFDINLNINQDNIKCIEISNLQPTNNKLPRTGGPNTYSIFLLLQILTILSLCKKYKKY
jgi:hypothetical protein